MRVTRGVTVSHVSLNHASRSPTRLPLQGRRREIRASEERAKTRAATIPCAFKRNPPSWPLFNAGRAVTKSPVARSPSANPHGHTLGLQRLLATRPPNGMVKPYHPGEFARANPTPPFARLNAWTLAAPTCG